MRTQLLPLNGASPLEITKEITLVGRSEDCDLRLDDKTISKLHCVLVQADGQLLVRDLGSTNGTRVNGRRVRRAAVLPNDRLMIAALEFRVSLDTPPLLITEDRAEQAAEDLALDYLAEGGEADAASPVKLNRLPDTYPDRERKGQQTSS